MARKLNRQQKKFQTAARAANATCHRDTNSVPAYKSCMRKEMKAKLGGRSRKAKRRRRR